MNLSQVRYKFSDAVERGFIKPGKQCMICGVCQSEVPKGTIIEHHEDYNKPLETITLCCSCHTLLHNGQRRGEIWDLDALRQDVLARNQRLVEFYKAHPDYTHKAIAAIFHMKRSRVSQILGK